jgi:molybdopterin-guanine dinucleotide biosynthesis protein A
VSGPEVSAAVLAGGESRRFGVDKALVPLPDGTTPMLGAVVDALLAVTHGVTIIAPQGRDYGRFGVPVVSEAIPGRGPLGGLEMALRQAVHDRCIVVACDQPFLNPDLLRWMCNIDFMEDALVPRISETGSACSAARPQPLPAIYRRSCLGSVLQLLDRGERRLGGLLEVITVRYVDEGAIRAVDPEFRSFVNLNTMEEWESARRASDTGRRGA